MADFTISGVYFPSHFSKVPSVTGGTP